MEYKVPKDRILICKTWIFDEYNPKTGVLTPKKLPDDEIYRMVIFMDGDIIDFRTGDIINHLHYDDGVIDGEVLINTMYVEELFSAKKVINEEEYEYAQELYEYYLMRKNLINEGKLLMFKQKRLY